MTVRFFNASFFQFMGTVGSGIFVLPYLFHQSNFLFACFFMLFLIFVTALLNQFYVDIIIKTPGDHQLAGYAGIYLGSRFRWLATLNLLLLAFGAITAYTKLFISFLILLFPGFTLATAATIYICLLSLIFLYRQSLNHNIFIIAPVFMLLFPLALFFISISNGYNPPSINTVLPNLSFYGAALFALSSFTIIPEVREILGVSNRHLQRKLSMAVLSGLLLAATSYYLYVYSVVSVSGSALSIDSVTGLTQSLPLFSKVIAAFGLVVTLRASFNFLIVLRELLYRDLHISKLVSNYLPILFPLLALTLGGITLIAIISLTGHVTIFISALIICLIRLKLNSNFLVQFYSLLIITSLCFGLIFNLVI